VTASLRSWARAVNAPTGNAPAPSFPFDQNARVVLESMPDGLVPSESVMTEFLDPPQDRGDWFAYKAWLQAARQLEADTGISGTEYTDMIDRFTKIMDGFVTWAEKRPDLGSLGYATDIPDVMRKAGADAWGRIRVMAKGPVDEFSRRSNVSDGTKEELVSLVEVLFQYVECMALELEATADQSDVLGIRSRFESGLTKPWEPAVTPETIGSEGPVIGADRLPKLPPVLGEGGGTTSESTEESTTESTEDRHGESGSTEGTAGGGE